jgi:hypothetical protein
MKQSLIIFLILGLICSIVWYNAGERFDKKKGNAKCWEILHYHHKERFPLYLVHLKSIFAGIILICIAFLDLSYKNEIIVFIGAAIIGLHISQFMDERKYILSFKKS